MGANLQHTESIKKYNIAENNATLLLGRDTMRSAQLKGLSVLNFLKCLIFLKGLGANFQTKGQNTIM